MPEIITGAQTTEGFWTIELVFRGEAHATQPRYVCHARDIHGAHLIAGRLSGAEKDTAGYNLHRLPDALAAGFPALGLGAHSPVREDQAWAKLKAN